MTWNHEIDTAPRDGSHVILAMPNKTTFRSYWCTPKGEPEHWCMLSHKNTPVAWMPWPEHPFQSPAGESLGANAGGDDVDGSAARAARQSDNTHPAGGVESGIDGSFVDETASGPDVKRAPLIIHKHIFLDDVGGSV
ncbi:hypothetical protein BMW22_15820 [Rhizobium leguminosarum]|uniref:Uncharacterized protein n=1 Tax=Rhizobium leguminosarum TaxID=384 RepID=A0A1L3ZB71_RHILE|nr:hypothetical protein [Rhizobium leguminosarum]API52893.1 hypothetical protein BMW22_15820 [Rhizobium leguminosarum]